MNSRLFITFCIVLFFNNESTEAQRELRAPKNPFSLSIREEGVLVSENPTVLRHRIAIQKNPLSREQLQAAYH